MRQRRQSGQTLIMFAITMTFLFLSLIALVGDADVLMVRYNQVNSEALLGAQAGATAVDTGALYDPVPKYQLKQDPPDDAKSRCESVPLTGGVPGTHSISCTATATTVTATVTWAVSLPVPLFVQNTVTVKATRTGQAVFGGATPTG